MGQPNRWPASRITVYRNCQPRRRFYKRAHLGALLRRPRRARRASDVLGGVAVEKLRRRRGGDERTLQFRIVDLLPRKVPVSIIMYVRPNI
jgi:hypothetical protein